jgi:3-hydroxybutyryl-CoA dehydrogenase
VLKPLERKENRSLKVLDIIKNVGVIGAGTMGIGIAEVAASKGQKVYLFDVNTEFAKASKEKMSKRLGSRVDRGKISAELRQQIIDNILVVDDLADLSPSDLVIEAIVENLKIKQDVFKQLESICDEDTLFASNTSSISITEIASILEKPENMIGIHFFNPAPVMKLVEVISGLRSSQEQIEIGKQLCEFWGKVAVVAQSTPGFIVNRVARPFYGEALKMLQERYAKPEIIDLLIKNAGFRMGPFALMDLIGIDINLAVSKTVYAAMYNDPRYRPSLIQQEMVSAKLLGKKSGKGFYDYSNDGSYELKVAGPQSAAKIASASYDCTNLGPLINSIKLNPDVIITEHESNVSLQVGDCAILLTNGMTCEQRQDLLSQNHICQIDLVLDFESCKVLNIAFNKDCPHETKCDVIGLLQSLGKDVVISDDEPALCVMRIVSMLINEAADALANGVCSEQDVDLAMQNGVNYPVGLIAWARKIGFAHLVETLENMHKWFGDDRYRVSTWLRKQ